MVNFSSLSLGTAVLAAQLAFGAPNMKRDSAVGDEVAVSAPNGTPITDTAELASQTAAEASMSMADSMATMTMADASSSTMMADSTSSVMMDTTSSVMMDTTSMMMDTTTMMMDTTTSAVMYDTTSAVMYDTTSTMAYGSMSTSVSYGSGSSSWGSSGYNDCVQQCVASFGSPMATYSASSTQSTDSSYSGSSGSGSGVTHTIIVAPTQGVLRYVPFATNASVGDTIKFMWGANMHTVTKSSQLELCNKTSDAPFASGVQNKSFVFTQVVNTTDPTFFYCGVPTHCEKGMFGIINPPNADVSTSNSTVSAMMPALVQNSSDVSAWNSYTQMMTSGSPAAASWGNSMDMSGMPGWSNNVMAENVMYTRNFLAANPDIIKSDGSVDLGLSSAPLMIPQDLSAAKAAASGSSSAASPAATSASSGASSASSSGSAAPSSASAASGARGLTASSTLAGLVALSAAFFAL